MPPWSFSPIRIRSLPLWITTPIRRLRMKQINDLGVVVPEGTEETERPRVVLEETRAEQVELEEHR